MALTLALLLGLQAVTTDLYLPALPLLTASFDASIGQAQLTLTALLLAFGVWFWATLIALNAWTLVQKHAASTGA